MNKEYVKEFVKLLWKRYLFLFICLCFAIFLVFYTKDISLILFFAICFISSSYILFRDISNFIKIKKEESKK
jgi:hypothetical protein